MALPPHAIDWMSRAEIDYLGPFVKAWAAFNAWYRHDSGEAQERAMLNYALSNANSRLRRRALPLLQDGNVTAESQALKQAVCDLQIKLDAIHFEVTRKNVGAERVSLRQVCIHPRPINNEHRMRNGVGYRVQRIAGGDIETTVTTGAGAVRFQHIQQKYDPNNVYVAAGFMTLSITQQVTLREFYDGCNPRPMVDLVQGGGPALQAGAMAFQCSSEHLLAGLVETIYTMRNALLHGEVDPDPQVLACYEPAYRIVMHFLKAIQ
jgi:hypothetical protein